GVVAFAHSMANLVLFSDENYAVALKSLLEPSFLIKGEASHTLFKVPDLLSGQASFFGDDKRINLSQGTSGASEPGGQILRKYTHDLILSRCDSKHYVPVIVHLNAVVGAALIEPSAG